MKTNLLIPLILAILFPPPYKAEIDIGYSRPKEFRPILTGLQDTVEMLFIGDVMMHKRQLESAYKGNGIYDFGGYFDNIGNLVEEADICVANMEFPVGTRPYTGYPSFSAPYGIIEEAALKGIDVMLLANNHICDKGSRGMKTTFEAYGRLAAKYGTRNTGAYADLKAQQEGYPLVIETNGIRIALVNFTYGTNGFPVPDPYRVNMMDTTQIKAAIRRAEADSADIVIALPHWGTEYRLTHDMAQERLARWLAGIGADAIVGTHPHVPQDTAHIDGKPVIYSLGNFISNMSLANTQVGLAARLRLVKPYGRPARIDSVGLEYLWCSRAGHKEDGFTTVVISEMEGKREQWADKSDYDNMMASRKRVERTIKITDK